MAATATASLAIWTAAAREQRPLVVVHPGSMCGSGDMNAPEDAATVRDQLAQLVYDWAGPVYVVDGFLSDELERSRYRDLGEALRVSCKERLDDCASGDTFPKKAGAWLTTRLDPAVPVALAGAWYSHDGHGCVEAMARELRESGFHVRFEADAILEDSDEPHPIPGEVLAPITVTPKRRPKPR